jgi:hypothetical protein
MAKNEALGITNDLSLRQAGLLRSNARLVPVICIPACAVEQIDFPGTVFICSLHRAPLISSDISPKGALG